MFCLVFTIVLVRGFIFYLLLLFVNACRNLARKMLSLTVMVRCKSIFFIQHFFCEFYAGSQIIKLKHELFDYAIMAVFAHCKYLVKYKKMLDEFKLLGICWKGQGLVKYPRISPPHPPPQEDATKPIEKREL